MFSKRVIIFGLIIFLIGIVLWQFGFFYRFNYLTAQMDTKRDQSRIVITENLLSESVDPVTYTGLNEEYGFHQHYASNISQAQLRGIKSYNSQIEKYLLKRNGGNWKKEYESKLKILIEDYKKYSR